MSQQGSWTASWRQVIRDRINRLDVAVTKAREDARLAAVHDGIKRAKTAARLDGNGIGPIDRLGEWATGSALETAWRVSLSTHGPAGNSEGTELALKKATPKVRPNRQL